MAEGREYSVIAHILIEKVLEQVHDNELDLSQHYEEGSLGYKLQIDLDHIGAGLNRNFHGILDQEKYRRFDVCLQRLADIFGGGHFYYKMNERRKEIKRRHDDSKRMKKCINRLTESLDEDNLDEIFNRL